MSGFRVFIICVMVCASSLFSLCSFLWLSTAWSISFGESFMMSCFSVSWVIFVARVWRFFGERSFESFTPSWVRRGRFSSFIKTPAMTSGPMMQPRPASSMPAINMLVLRLVCGVCWLWVIMFSFLSVVLGKVYSPLI